MNNLRIHESVAAIAAGYRPESHFIAEAEKLGKPVDEHKWNKAKELAGKELGKKTGDRFYAYTMGIYKKMMGEQAVVEAKDYKDHSEIEADIRKTQNTILAPGSTPEKDEAARKKIKDLMAHPLYKAKVSKEKERESDRIMRTYESEQVEDKTKKADTEHDEDKETQEDPTREKLETAKDEADEKKGGPAELAADLRVSIRIEKMGVGRYKRMLSKHELSADDEKWLKQRITDLEACIKAMEDKLPALEKEAEGKSEDIKESIKVGIKSAVMELVTGK